MVVGRLLMAVLLKHHGLGSLVISLLSADRSTGVVPPAPRCLVEVCKVVQQARTALIKVLLLSSAQSPQHSLFTLDSRHAYCNMRLLEQFEDHHKIPSASKLNNYYHYTRSTASFPGQPE